FLGVMHLKGREPLRALRDTLGEGRFATALGQLLETHAGGHFTWDDFRATMLSQADEATRPSLEDLFDGWLTSAKMPGFVVTSSTLQRLKGERQEWQASV